MSILRLDPPIFVETPRGPGWAHIFESIGTHTAWTVELAQDRRPARFRGEQLTFADEAGEAPAAPKRTSLREYTETETELAQAGEILRRMDTAEPRKSEETKS